MNDTVYPNQGLVDILQQAMLGLSTVSGGVLTWDLDTANAQPNPLILADYALTVGAAQTSLATAVSTNLSGLNSTVAADFAANPHAVVGNLGVIQAALIKYQNVSGSPFTVYGTYSYNNAALYGPSNALWSYTKFDSPLVIPNLGFFYLFPVLGDQSFLQN